MLITFFDIKGIICFEFIPHRQTVNQAYYMEILKRLREAVPIKGHELWPKIEFTNMIIFALTRLYYQAVYGPKVDY
jgi:hypothetical protein